MKNVQTILKKISKNSFYIVLFLCLCAIGVSGYVMFRTPELPDADEVLGDWEDSLEFPLPTGQDTQDVVQSQPIEIPDEYPPQESAPEQKTEPAPAAVTTAKQEKAPAKPKAISYVLPLEGTVTQPFSGDELVKNQTLGDWRTHPGVDIQADAGTNVCAIADGTVRDVKQDELMGYTVVIDHDGKTVSTYCNLQSGVVVKPGQRVKAGDVIGGVGESAMAESMDKPHLHLELCIDGKNIDPMSKFS